MLTPRNWCCLALAIWAGWALPLRAEEEPDRFLEELRSRGYFDVAAQYLQWARTSPLVSPEFKSGIAYQEAVTSVRQAAALADHALAEQQLQRALAKFDEFVQSHPDTALRNDIKLQRGRINVSLAERKLLQADRPGVAPEPFRAAARQLLEAALATFSEVGESVQAELKPLEGKLLTDKGQAELRNKLRLDWLNSQWLTCQVEHRLARTYESGSQGRRSQLTKAAAACGKFYDKFSTAIPPPDVAALARLQQGICLQELGNHKLAVECFSDLTNYDEDALKDRKKLQFYLQVTRHAQPSLLALKKYDEAARGATTRVGAEDARLPDWAAVRFFAAQALKLKADALTDKADQEAALGRSAKLAQGVAAMPGEFQVEARKFLEAMGKTVVPVASIEGDTFAEVMDRARLALQDWQTAAQAMGQAPADKKSTLGKELDQKRRAALDRYRQAWAKAARGASSADVGIVLYSLSLLYLDEKNFPAAAVVGEHLARNYPDARGAKEGARVALIAWASEHDAADEVRPFASARIRTLARYILDQWPDTDESAHAASLLLNLAIQDQNIDDALGYLEKIPPSSPRRADADMLVGVNLWRVYLLEQRQQENEGAEAEARKVKLQEKREKVERVLTAGVTRLKEKEVDTSLARAVLSLAQLYVDTNRAEQALQWLNDPKVGSLTLIKAGNRHAQAPEFQSEAYKVALRSYISLLPKQKDQAAREATMKSAEAMMNLLEKEGAKDQQAADRLTQIYIVMGRELESQLKEVGRDRKAREALSEAFEQFLGRIASRPGNNYNTLIWVAQTFFNLGSAADAGQREVTPAVKNYFGKAAGTYRQILAADAASPGFVPSDRVKAGIVMNLVRSLRRMGDLDGAMALLRPMLTQQPNNVAAQIEAAQTLQDRGEEASFEKAVFGDFPDPKTKENIVWGWTRLAGRAATNPKLADIYLEAALRSYECRYLLGLKIGSPRKEKLLRAAKTGIEALYGKHPALGNPKTKHQLDNVVRHLTPEQRSRLPELKRQFDILARDIQKGLNEPPTGLKAFDPPTSETPTTAPPAN